MKSLLTHAGAATILSFEDARAIGCSIRSGSWLPFERRESSRNPPMSLGLPAAIGAHHHVSGVVMRQNVGQPHVRAPMRMFLHAVTIAAGFGLGVLPPRFCRDDLRHRRLDTDLHRRSIDRHRQSARGYFDPRCEP